MSKEYNISVEEIMSKHLHVLHPKDKLDRAKEIFNQFGIHHIPIAVMGEIRGILSYGDILFLEGMVTNSFDRFIKIKKYKMATVDEVMTKDPFCLPYDAPLSSVTKLMLEKRINCIPIQKDGELVGIVTHYDLIKNFHSILEPNQ